MRRSSIIRAQSPETVDDRPIRHSRTWSHISGSTRPSSAIPTTPEPGSCFAFLAPNRRRQPSPPPQRPRNNLPIDRVHASLMACSSRGGAIRPFIIASRLSQRHSRRSRALAKANASFWIRIFRSIHFWLNPTLPTFLFYPGTEFSVARFDFRWLGHVGNIDMSACHSLPVSGTTSR